MTGNEITIETSTGDLARDARLMREMLAYLVREEALHWLQTAVALDESPQRATSWSVARRGEAIVGVGSITGEFNMLLSRLGDDDAVPALVEAFLARKLPIPGVMGNERDALAFATAWNARSGARIVPGMRQAIMECRAVRPPLAVPGTWRRAVASDREWLLPWLQAFADEADPDPTPHRDAGEAILRSDQPPGGMFVWRDTAGEPVSVAGYKGWTMNGVRIGPVYTPPEHRSRGYGSAVTAVTTQALLDEGWAFTCLYTDLANATSNHIYAGIGYEPVATSVVLRFGSPDDDRHRLLPDAWDVQRAKRSLEEIMDVKADGDMDTFGALADQLVADHRIVIAPARGRAGAGAGRQGQHGVDPYGRSPRSPHLAGGGRRHG